MKRQKSIDIAFCSAILFFIASAFTLSYISCTMGIMGEENTQVSIEYKLFQDVTYLSDWYVVFAVVYSTVKIYLTATRNKPVYFKYFDLSLCAFALITMIIATIGVFMDIAPPFTSDVMWYRFSVIHYITPIGFLIYLSYYQLNYIYSVKEIILAGIPNALIVLTYVIWISFTFSDSVLRTTNVPFPYEAVAPQVVGVQIYVTLCISAVFGYGIVTSLSALVNNAILTKFRGPIYGQLYFKRDIFIDEALAD
ncbi:hypothetical protein SCHIN_v1c01210 [Spiroplasma chinense]|uniref:Transmembrane protein n=1 Tax=Spiroplasma chinense TaxID=216932 RepID=A0A5B9Y3R7_9MOLU|nr:hypothetical protein [Spiroplasma chinense]QEH61319.1 hypothetical protein SCHIN_v1c01210 [Spiroplasma chinense]